jgi:CRISPR-associated endonuclease/helicase Cas3
MCTAHRQVILDNVKEDLKTGKKNLCLSTQLIDAGVDIDFAIVIRDLVGLSSMAQAAGLCNRNGDREP